MMPLEFVHAVLVVRAEEAWEPVLFGGMIPILGALAVVFLIWYAVREPPEEEEDGDEEALDDRSSSL